MVWIGDGELRAETETLIKHKGIGERFHLLGASRRTLRSFFPLRRLRDVEPVRGSAVFRRRGDDLRIPVVATAVNSVPEVVIPGTDGVAGKTG